MHTLCDYCRAQLTRTRELLSCSFDLEQQAHAELLSQVWAVRNSDQVPMELQSAAWQVPNPQHCLRVLANPALFARAAAFSIMLFRRGALSFSVTPSHCLALTVILSCSFLLRDPAALLRSPFLSPKCCALIYSFYLSQDLGFQGTDPQTGDAYSASRSLQ